MTPKRMDMAIRATILQQRAERNTCKSFAAEARITGESPEELRARWDDNGGYQREWIKRYHLAKRLSGRNYADGIM